MVKVLVCEGLLSRDFEFVFNVMDVVIFEESFFLFEGFLFKLVELILELVVVVLVDHFVLVGLLLQQILNFGIDRINVVVKLRVYFLDCGLLFMCRLFGLIDHCLA